MQCARQLIAPVLLFAFFLLASQPARAVDIQEVTSPGGIKAWLVEEPSIPIVSLNVSWRGGSSLDPAGKAGLAYLASSTMDEGAGEFDSKAFQGRLSDLAIQLGFDASKDSFSGEFKTLSENTEEAFRLFGLAITDPRFDEEPVERIRGQILASLDRKLSDPNSLAGRAWFELAFGDHPYAHPSEGTLETMAAITREDLARFAKTHLGKDNMFVGVVGDITAAELGPLLDMTFGKLPEKVDVAQVPQTEPLQEAAVMIIPQDIPQSVVIFGGQGVKRDDPDYYAAYVLNYILGGGSFQSRLTDEIREKRGLVYSVYSYLYPMKAAGLHMGGFGTSNASVKAALDLVEEELRRIRKDGVTAEELDAAKTYINGSFPLSLSSNDRIADILVAMQFSNLPPSYLNDRAALINSVSQDDIKRVARRLLDPEKLIVVVAGKPENLEAVGPGMEKK
ncbi:insulinase family protein [Sneathiella chungangensis]|uniref:Insulinase family protein n=1 Tax=Sneathiella chungangensis TaxID=1418234 RepID=A0A845MIT3_9PROT|nr:pitrilysin family protein [Sneathiella chungangensis]MZR23522.1 insulinase family protein [Sneathiella chungangensis]